MTGIEITDDKVIISKETIDRLLAECDHMIEHCKAILQSTPHHTGTRVIIEKYHKRADILRKIRNGRLDYIN